MKKKILLLTTLLLSLGTFTACNNDDGSDGPEPGVIWDIIPFCINFQVQDGQQNDLLNPDTPGSLAHQGIKALYGGHTFEKDSLPTNASTRDILPRFYGLQSVRSSNGKYYLSFGEFASTNSYTDEQLVIDWNDGTPHDTLTFSNRFGWKNHKPDIHRSVSLNGTPCAEGMIVITHIAD